MTIPEILEKLERWDGPFPYEAVAEAKAQREAITPRLIEILHNAAANVEALSEDEDLMAHLYAMYLLAEFRETRAYRPLVQLFSFSGEAGVEDLEDVATEDLHRMLASVWDGDDAPLKGLIESPESNEWVRGAGVRAMAVLAARGLKPREEVMAYFGSLLNGPPVEPYSNFWNEIASCCADLYPGEVLPELRRAFEKGLVDPGFIGQDELDNEMSLGKEAVLARLGKDATFSLIGDTAEEMGGWDCFSEKYREKVFGRARALAQWGLDSEHHREFAEEREEAGGTIRCDEPKTGRNEPCPCGSGKKYKKCCGA